VKAGGSDKSRVLGYEFDYEIAGLR
jgi:hypothetical protein